LSCVNLPKDEKLVRLWVRNTDPADYDGEHISTPVSPILFKNKIITANGIDGVVAFNKRWGTPVWNLKVDGGVSSPLLLVSNYLFFTGYDGTAYSISAIDGKILWKKTVEYPTTQTLFYENGRVYLYTKNSEIMALEASSGEEVWTYSKKNQRKISVSSIGNFLSLGQLLISGLSTGEVVALEKSNGKVRWIRKLNFNSRFRDIKTLALYDTDKLVVAGYDDHIYNLDALSGALKWKRKFSVVTNFVTMGNGDLCFGTFDS
jgi:outer membrane protein assembly factor BamB